MDGGIAEMNITQVFEVGADYVAVGSEIMQAEDPLSVFKSLEEMVQSTEAT